MAWKERTLRKYNPLSKKKKKVFISKKAFKLICDMI